MFTLERQPNPLNQLIAHTGSAYVQDQLAKQAEQSKMAKFQKATEGLGPESSDMDWIQALGRVGEEFRNPLLQLHGNVSKSKLEQRKALAEQEENKPTAGGAKLAGISEDEYKNMSLVERKNAIKANNKSQPSTFQPVPPEIAAATKKILKENPTVSSDELGVLMDEAGVPRGYSGSFIENRRQQGVADLKKKENISKKFDKPIEKIRDTAQNAMRLLPLTEASIQNNERYTTGEKTWDTVLESTQSPFLAQFKSRTGQELEAYTPLAISSFGQKMSGQLTNAKMAAIGKKAVNIGKDKNANRMLLYLDYYDHKLDVLRAEATNKILEESSDGLAPPDFDKRVNEMLRPYQKMINQDITKLLNDEMPTSRMSQLSTGPSQNQQTAPSGNLIEVISPDGVRGRLPENLLNDPRYQGFKKA